MYIYVYMYPIESIYGIFTYISHKNQPNVGKYTIHGFYGYIWLTSVAIDIGDIGHLYGGIRLHVETISMNTMTMRGAH